MNGKSLAQAQMAALGGVVCLTALAGWWSARLPPPPSTPANFSEPAPARAPEPAAVPARSLSADIVRILPNGDVVIAGRTEPGAKVTLLDQGVPLAETTADPKSGEFVFLPPRLEAGEHKLSLRSAPSAGNGAGMESDAWSFAISRPSSATGAVAPVVATDPAGAATATVARGDTLWGLSRIRLGNGKFYSTIFRANAAKIHDPNLIYPGQELTIP